MSLPRRTIHYVAQHEDRNNPFTEDHTLAAVYIKAETQRRSSRLLGIHSVYYPIQLRNWGNYTVLLDLLGLNQLKFKVNVIPDVSIIRDELEAASLKPEEFLALLRKRTDYFKSFAGENAFTLRGLLGKPPNEGLNVLQRDSTAFEETSFIFPPILKKGDISSLLGDLDSIHQTLIDDRKQLENAVGYLKESLEVVNKVITEEIRNLKDSSSRIKNKLGKDLKKKKR